MNGVASVLRAGIHPLPKTEVPLALHGYAEKRSSVAANGEESPPNLHAICCGATCRHLSPSLELANTRRIIKCSQRAGALKVQR